VEQVAELVARVASAPDCRSRVEAYGRLVEQFRGMACGYAYSILGDFHLAEDVAQNAFITAFGKLGQLQQPQAFPGWFRRIVWSECGRATRRRQRPATGLDDAAHVASAVPPPHDAMEREEAKDRVHAAIRTLPDSQREVTTLFYIDGYSQKQIADFLEVSVGTVNNRLSASRTRLKERMLNMVQDMLHGNAPDERFDRAVLLKLPQVSDMMEPVAHLPSTLDAFQARLILSALPNGSEIRELAPLIPIYRYPLVAHCRLPDGQDTAVEVHAYAHPLDSAERQARLLGILAELGLPVQKLLAGPALHPDFPDVGPMAVLTHLEGEDLPFWNATTDQIDLICRLVIEGVTRLHALTEPLQRHPISKTLPRRSLIWELDLIADKGGPWMTQPLFRQALARLRPALEAVAVPLVFSNGLNLTWNFKYDGRRLTGFQLFERACLEDPHIQFAKYKYWAIDTLGWGPFERAGLVERYLYDQDVSRSQFAPRLALRCLARLQECIPVRGDDDQWARERQSCLSLLEDSMRILPAN